MPELYMAEVDYKEAKELADLISIYHDLSYAEEALKCLLQLLSDHSKNNIVMQSLWTAALVAYVRCFSRGKRFGLSENIFKGLAGDPIGCHKYYKNLRDKHIAHSVNPFEQVVVGIVLSEPDNPKREVEGVATLSLKLAHSDIDGVVTLLRLASTAQEEVAKQTKKYELKVLEVGKALPIEDLYSKASIRTVVPGPEDAGKARK